MRTKPSIHLRWQGYYDCTLDNINKYILKEPSLPRIYKLSKLVKSCKLAEFERYSRLTPFYVSETLNIYKSLTRHLSDREISECVKKELKDKI